MLKKEGGFVLATKVGSFEVLADPSGLPGSGSCQSKSQFQGGGQAGGTSVLLVEVGAEWLEAVEGEAEGESHGGLGNGVRVFLIAMTSP